MEEKQSENNSIATSSITIKTQNSKNKYANEIEKVKSEITFLSIFIIIVVIIVCSIIFIVKNILVGLVGVSFLIPFFNKLLEVKNKYNCLMSKINKKVTDNKITTKTNTTVIPKVNYISNNYEKKDVTDKNELCDECFKSITFEQSLNFEGLCTECYKEKYGEEKHYCQMCGELITEEEYDDYGGFCEECYDDINTHYQNNGLDDYTRPYKDIIDDLDVWDD